MQWWTALTSKNYEYVQTYILLGALEQLYLFLLLSFVFISHGEP